tara:strand:- start:21681 stop:22244 length:564 start_codon:yes stop_codon:yes gene_type:complete
MQQDVTLEGERFLGRFQGELKADIGTKVVSGRRQLYEHVSRHHQWWEVVGSIVERESADAYRLLFSTPKYNLDTSGYQEYGYESMKAPNFIVGDLHHGIVVIRDKKITTYANHMGPFYNRVNPELIDLSATYDLLLERTVDKLKATGATAVHLATNSYKLKPAELKLSELVELGYVANYDGQIGLRL